ncbi:hypothetical protein AAHA92_06010 [Salvia divinorum]|uniref:Protein kinase domain-containing protein n=1 Tax=Salvia divinorum TaxID=28513 RepID=A0ABD1I4C7_SALDI
MVIYVMDTICNHTTYIMMISVIIILELTMAVKGFRTKLQQQDHRSICPRQRSGVFALGMLPTHMELIMYTRFLMVVNGSVPMGFIHGSLEGSPMVRTALENQSPWAESSQKVVGSDGSLMSDFPHIQAVKFPRNTHTLENHHPCNVEPVQSAAVLATPVTSRDPFTMPDPVLLVDDASVAINVAASVIDPCSGSETNKSSIRNKNGAYDESNEKNNGAMAKDSCDHVSIDMKSYGSVSSAFISSNVPKSAFENGDETNVGAPEQQDERLEFLLELIASVKEATLQSLKEVKAKVREDSDLGSVHDTDTKEDAQNHKDGVDDNMELEVDSDNDSVEHSKIEMTKAESEALGRRLQTIRNEDLEEIRELGSGTYGAVFHGKWKGSDVAIKRIKASCFSGRSSERERLV